MKKYLSLILTCLFITNLYSASDSVMPAIIKDKFVSYINQLLNENYISKENYEKFCNQLDLILTNNEQELDRIRQNILCLATENDDLDMIKYCIQNSDLFNLEKHLYNAISSGSVNVFKYIASSGIRIHSHVLISACESNNKNSLEIVKYLLETPNLNLNLRINRRGSPLHTACKCSNLDIVKYLIDSGRFNINEQAIMQLCTPLMLACMFGRLDIVKYLLYHPNIDLSLKNYRDLTPLHIACASPNLDVVEFLVNSGKFNINDNNNQLNMTPLELACDTYNDPSVFIQHIGYLGNYARIIKFLLKQKNINKSGLASLKPEKLAVVLNLLDESIAEYIELENLGDNIKNPEIAIILLQQYISIENEKINIKLKEIYEAIFYISLPLEKDDRPTIERFLHIKNLITGIILTGSLEQLSKIKPEYIKILFSQNQVTEIIIEKLKAIKFDETTTLTLLSKICPVYNLKNLFYKNNHILWHSLSRGFAARNVSKLLIALCPTILKVEPNNMHNQTCQELIEILKEDQKAHGK